MMNKITLAFIIISIIATTSVNAIATQLSSQSSYIPAVYQTDTGFAGVLASVTVDTEKGSGHVYVDTLPLTEIDTQSSARLAKEVAGNVLGYDMSKYDLFYTIRSDSPIIGGPSAGGAMTAITIATLLNLTVDKTVIMTGTINPDGSIGPIGGVIEKAQAVAEGGGRIFLIPEGQSNTTMQTTERTVTGNGVQITTSAKNINLIDYAKKEWGLTVIEINNVRDALRYMTGYMIETHALKPLETNKTIEAIMKRMAELFINDVDTQFNETKELFDKIIIPLRYRDDIETLLTEQTDIIANAKQLFESSKYYSASSKAFYASIQLEYAKNIIGVVSSKDAQKASKDVLDTADEMIMANEKIINTSVINSVTDIEIVSASEERLSEAKSNLDGAKKLLNTGNYIDAVYAASYAIERSNSAVMWHDLINNFNETDFTFNYTTLRNLAQMRIDDADATIVYAQSLSIDTTNVNTFIDSARNDINAGSYSSALSNAVMAKANAELLMDTRGIDNLSTKIDIYDRNALESIADAQESGATPILALSYYELANSFGDDDTANKLVYLRYAKEFAGLSLELKSLNTGDVSDEVEVNVTPVMPFNNIVIYAGLGIVAGIIVTLAFLKAGRWL